MSESVTVLCQKHPWLKELVSLCMPISHAWEVEWNSVDLLKREAGRSDEKCKAFSRKKGRMRVYLKWRRWTWLIGVNGEVIARVHPRWWESPSRRIFTIMEKIGEKVGTVAYIVEVSQDKDEKNLRIYTPAKNSSFADLFHVAVEKERRRGKPMKRTIWSNKTD